MYGHPETDDQFVRKGMYDKALGLLLSKTEMEGMTMNEYNRWSRAVWDVLERKATLQYVYVKIKANLQW